MVTLVVYSFNSCPREIVLVPSAYEVVATRKRCCSLNIGISRPRHRMALLRKNDLVATTYHVPTNSYFVATTYYHIPTVTVTSHTNDIRKINKLHKVSYMSKFNTLGFVRIINPKHAPTLYSSCLQELCGISAVPFLLFPLIYRTLASNNTLRKTT